MAENFRRKSAAFSMIVWPYMMTLFVLFLGSFIGDFSVFQRNVGVHPAVFFITGSFLLLISLIFFDDAASRFYYDEMTGTLPYIIASPTSRFVLALSLSIPRFIMNILIGFSSLIPIYVFFMGLAGFYEAFTVISLSIFGSLTFSTMALVFASLVLISEGGWRVMSVMRPLLLLLSGVMYPRFLLPILAKVISGFIPLSHTIEAIQLYMSLGGFTDHTLILMGLASALAVAYAPISRLGLRMWENKLVKKGVKV
jgi:ABC-2 type transport system permease protein